MTKVSKEKLTNLRKLQLEELSIMNEFVRICNKKKYNYYLLGGTLLGAVRHNGFIPWDDDVDVCMPREDYERFIKLSSDEFNDGFEIVNYDTNKDYRYPWARLITKNIKIINHMANIPREEYAWIDIIPLDGFPNKGIKRFFHKIRLSFWWNLNQIVQFDELVDQKRKRSLLGKIAIKISSMFKGLGKMINYKTCLKKVNQILMKYSYESETEEVINFLAAYGFKEVFLRDSFKKYKLYDFEGEKYKGPYDYNSVLTRIYGDYTTMPPIDERNKHQAEIIIEEERKK